MDEDDAARTAGRYGYHGHHHAGGAAPVGGHDVQDPVCGVALDPHMTEHRSERGARVFYFHAAACKAAFDADPARYSG